MGIFKRKPKAIYIESCYSKNLINHRQPMWESEMNEIKRLLKKSWSGDLGCKIYKRFNSKSSGLYYHLRGITECEMLKMYEFMTNCESWGILLVQSNREWENDEYERFWNLK